MDNRVLKLEYIGSMIPNENGSILCPYTKYNLTDSLILLTRIGSNSINGEVIKTCFPNNAIGYCDDSSVLLATKKIPLSEKDIQFIKKHDTKDTLVTSPWVELACLELCKHLVQNNICPNLPLYIKYFICDKCNFENIQILQGAPCIYLINEYANGGDLKEWCKSYRTGSEWMIMYFQVFTGLYSMQKYFNIRHHDLHWGNVLVHEVKPGGYYKYIIDSVVYYIPNNGYIFTLWDFGYARSPGKLEITDLKNYYKAQVPDISIDYFRITNALVWAENRSPGIVPRTMEIFYNDISAYYNLAMPLRLVIPMFFNKRFTTIPANNDILAEYSLDKKIYIDKYGWLLNDALKNQWAEPTAVPIVVDAAQKINIPMPMDTGSD